MLCAAPPACSPVLAGPHPLCQHTQTQPGSDAFPHACGCCRSILVAERVALNFMQRMSGIATLTRHMGEAVQVGAPANVLLWLWLGERARTREDGV